MPILTKSHPMRRGRRGKRIAMQVKKNLNPIQLDWGDGERPITVTPKDQDRFTTTVQEAIRACKAELSSAKFMEQFRSGLLERLAAWIRDHAEKVAGGYITIRDSTLLFLVVRKMAGWDGKFDDDLTALDVDIANDPKLDLIRLNVISLPKGSDAAASSFLDPEFTLEYKHAR